MVQYFSDDVKEVISVAKDVALDLGANEISTIHFFLANCKIDSIFNPREFLFKSEDDFEKFYLSHRVSEPRVITDNLPPLTHEAEEAIRRSLKLKRTIKSKQVQPVHLLLAAAKMPHSLFLSICDNKETTYTRLFEFYKCKGCLIETPDEPILTKMKKAILNAIKT